MSGFTDVLKTIAPTVASAFLGPLAGPVIAAAGAIFGISEPTQDKIKDIIESGQMTGEQVAALKELEMKLKAEEQERGFRYAELEFKDRDSARQANVQGGTQRMLFWLSLVLLTACLGGELVVLFHGLPVGANEIVVGRILGLLDSVSLMILAYWYGSSSGSVNKTALLAGSVQKT